MPDGAPRDPLQHELKWIDLAFLSVRSFAAKPARTLLTVLGTAVGIATVVVLVSLGYGLQGILLGRLITTQESLVTFSASYPSDSNLVIDATGTRTVAAIPNVKAVSPVGEFPGSASSGGVSGLVLIDIVDANYFPLSGNLPDLGAGFGNAPGAVVSTQALQILGLPTGPSSIGKDVSVTAFYPSADGASTYDVASMSQVPITGISQSETQPTVTVLANVLPQAPPYYKQIYVEASDNTTFDGLRSTLTSKGFLISAHVDLVRQAQQVTNIITIILGIFGIAALIVSAIGMFNTMIVGFLERTYEVGVMKAIGATDRDVRRMFLAEAFIMGVSGGIVGVLLGLGLGALFNFLLGLLATHYGGKAFTLFASPLWFLGLVIVSSAIIGLAAGFIPARRASSLSPKEAFVKK